MHEILMDVTGSSTIYTLYGSIVLVFFLQYFWNLKIEYKYIQSTRSVSDIYIRPFPNCLNKRTEPINSIIVQITKSIRRKVHTHDDEDGHVYFLNTHL